MAIVGPTFQGACPTCGGDVTRVEGNAPRRLGQSTSERRSVYRCANDNGQRLVPHVPSDWAPPAP